MNRKLLFFDIDGTLLAGGMEGYVPESALKALKKAQENGHICVVNTGRTRGFLPRQISAYPFDGYIYGCGTEVVLHGEKLYERIVPDGIKRALIPAVRAANMQIVAEGPEHIYYEEREDIYEPLRGLLEFYDTFGDVEGGIVKTMDSDELEFSKFIVVFDPKDVDIPLFISMIEDTFAYIPRETMGELSFAEIVPKDCSKATGIDLLAKHYGVTLDDCYVFGDSNNDLSMLTHVKHSIAMEKSSPEVLKVAEYVTTDIDEDGIWNALVHYGLIESRK